MAQEDETRIPGERAETVSGRRIDNSPVLKRGAVAFAVVAFIGFALWSTTGNKANDENTQPERIVIRQTNDFEAAKEKVEPAQAVPEVKLPIRSWNLSPRRKTNFLIPPVARRSWRSALGRTIRRSVERLIVRRRLRMKISCRSIAI
jgi:type IV secretory pathway VirB10-like protein